MHQKRATSPSTYSKPCDLCRVPHDVLVRCQIDDTSQWYLICTHKCWKHISGGIVDGDTAHPHYKYGGMWKNKHAGVSAKKPKPKKDAVAREWEGAGRRYVVNNRVGYDGKEWVCRRSHDGEEVNAPGRGYRFWKEAG